MADNNTPQNLRSARLKPYDTIMASFVALLWAGLFGGVVASHRMIDLVVTAYRVTPTALTAFVSAIGSATANYWLISFPVSGILFVVALIWALAGPDTRQFRLSVLLLLLTASLFLVLVATYIPFAQAAYTIAHPSGLSGTRY